MVSERVKNKILDNSFIVKEKKINADEQLLLS